MIKKKRKWIILGGSGLLGQSIVKEIKDEMIQLEEKVTKQIRNALENPLSSMK